MNGFAREAAGRPAATVLYSIIDPENRRMDWRGPAIHRR